jgi:hypothetical protein
MADLDVGLAVVVALCQRSPAGTLLPNAQRVDVVEPRRPPRRGVAHDAA